jgi:hypothetical protein
LISLIKKKDVHSHLRTQPKPGLVVVCAGLVIGKQGRCVMSYSDPAHWRGRAEELRGLADKMNESVSKGLMHKMAEDYERLAETAEQRVKDARPLPGLELVGVPRAVQSFARRKSLVRTQLPGTAGADIPRFLKQGPATAEEVGAPVSPVSIVPEL